MATYKSFAELQGKQLRSGDYIIFKHDGFHVEYEVFYEDITEVEFNFKKENKIFELLGLDPYEFCKQHYTKLPDDWDEYIKLDPEFFPPFYKNDFESITKAVLELFRLIEEIPKQLAETSEILFID